MDEQRDAANANAAETARSAEANPGPVGSGLKTPRRCRSGFTVVRIVLGVLLLATAGLKLFDPSPDSFSGLELLSSPRWQMAAIEAEAVLGLWLLSGAFPRLLWLAALIGFALLGSVSMYMGFERQPSCGCLGAKLTVSPWYALTLDLAALAALVWWRRRQGHRADGSYSVAIRRVLAVAAGSGVTVLAGLGGLTWMYGSPSEALVHVRGESLTVEPSLINVGDGVAGEQRTFPIQLSNFRDTPIKVIGGTANCTCIATSALPIIVPPRDSRLIAVRINFRGSPGRFQHSFVLYTNVAGQATVTARFAGRVRETASP